MRTIKVGIKIIDIGKDFSQEPFGRYDSDGSFNGERFRILHLIPAFTDTKNDKIEVLLDNVVDGWEYGSSFLQESFGELARELGGDALKRLIITTASPDYKMEIDDYIAAALKK